MPKDRFTSMRLDIFSQTRCRFPTITSKYAGKASLAVVRHASVMAFAYALRAMQWLIFLHSVFSQAMAST